MPLSPSPSELLARARADLRLGLPVALSGPSGTMLAAAAETLGAARLDGMRALGVPVLALTGRRAQTLKAHVYDRDLARIVIPPDVDTGWVAAMADPAADLATPLKGPHRCEREGSADLHRFALALMKSARLLPAAVLVTVAPGFAQMHDLTRIDTTMPVARAEMEAIVSARVPLTVSEAGRLHIFRPSDGAEEHYAVEIGAPDRDKAVLARLHSACFTGDLLGSLKCDCGPQLRGALEHMGREGAGVLLYLNQEGRGIGLANKMRAYFLQDQGFDTVEANHRLGFEDDERDFRIGAEILQKLGFGAVRLLTNNPAKVAMLEGQGIRVDERVPLKVGLNPLNKKYLDTKAKKSGHIL